MKKVRLKQRPQRITVYVNIPLDYEQSLFEFLENYAKSCGKSLTGLVKGFLTRPGLHLILNGKTARAKEYVMAKLIELAIEGGWSPPPGLLSLEEKINATEQLLNSFVEIIEKLGIEETKRIITEIQKEVNYE